MKLSISFAYACRKHISELYRDGFGREGCIASLGLFLDLIDYLGNAPRPSGTLRSIVQFGNDVCSVASTRSMASSRTAGGRCWDCYKIDRWQSQAIASSTMKSRTEYLTLNIPSKMAFENITSQVEDVVRASGVAEGLVLCNSMHITASVFINDDERGLHHDFGVWLEKLAPFNPDPNHYHHNRTGEDNADAHLKRQIMGREVIVAITKGKLDLGPWEQIFYGEFDGHRPKRVLVKVIGE
jgi:secondary thiamine-phosphate synthase enzyme